MNRSTLSFEALRVVNVRRCITEFYHSLGAWSVAEWGNATAGECGEACNVAKKMLRARGNHANLNKDGKDITDYKQELADEIADMVIYADLWAASEGISLAQAVVDKFNRDSDKHGVSAKIYV